MTVSNNSYRDKIVGTGIVKQFTTSFKVFQADDLRIKVVTTDGMTTHGLTLNTHYTVAGLNRTDGAIVTLLTPPSTSMEFRGHLVASAGTNTDGMNTSVGSLNEGWDIFIENRIDETQEKRVGNEEKINRKELEDALDKLTLLIQQAHRNNATWEGAWVDDKNYERGAMVFYNGQLYLAKEASGPNTRSAANMAIVPSDDATETFWEALLVTRDPQGDIVHTHDLDSFRTELNGLRSDLGTNPDSTGGSDAFAKITSAQAFLERLLDYITTDPTYDTANKGTIDERLDDIEGTGWVVPERLADNAVESDAIANNSVLSRHFGEVVEAGTVGVANASEPTRNGAAVKVGVRVNFDEKLFGVAYVDVSTVTHSPDGPDGMAGTADDAIVAREIELQISGAIQGGLYEIFIKKSGLAADTIAEGDIEVASGSRGTTINFPGGSGDLDQQGGIVRLLIKIETINNSGVIATAYAIGSSGGTAGVGGGLTRAALSALFEDTPTLGDNDNILVFEQGTSGFKNHISNRASLSDYTFLGARFNESDTTRHSVGFEFYRSFPGENMIGLGLGNNIATLTPLISTFNSDSSTRRVLAAKDVLGRSPNMALMIRDSNKRRIILLSDYNEEAMELKILQGILETSLTAQYTANLGSYTLKDGSSTRGVGGYQWDLTEAQANILFPNLPSLDGSSILIVPSYSTQQGSTRQVRHVSMDLADAWYEPIVDERARKVTVPAVVNKIDEGLGPKFDKITKDIADADNTITALTERVDHILPDAFSMVVTGTTFPTTGTIPAVGASFDVVLRVRAANLAPSGNLVVHLNGFAVHIPTQPTLTEGTNVVACTLNSGTLRSNLQRSIPNRGRLEIQLEKGAAASEIAHIPVSEPLGMVWQTKTGVTNLSGDNRNRRFLLNNLYLSSTFNNLVVGRSYFIRLRADMTRSGTESLIRQIIEYRTRGFGVATADLELAGTDDGFIQSSDSNIFEARATSLTLFSSLDTDNTGDVRDLASISRIRVYATLMEIPNASATTKFN